MGPTPITSAPGVLLAQSGGMQVVDWARVVAFRDPAAPAAIPDAPGAPTNLSGSVSGSTVSLTWTPPASGPVTSYVLEAGSAPGQSNIANFNTGNTATTFTTTGVPDGTYYVRVRATNADGAGSASNEVSVLVGSTGGCPTPPAPGGFTATSSGTTVTMSWTAVSGALAYIVEAGTESGRANLTTFETGTATSFSGTASNGTYYLRVRVRTACGTSGTSIEAVVTVGTAAPTPANLTGLWRGTLTVREASGTTQRAIEIDFVQSGTRLTGTARGRFASFDLTQSATDPLTFSGALNLPGNTGCEVMPGSLRAPDSTRMTGAFTCAIASNEFDLTRVP